MFKDLRKHFARSYGLELFGDLDYQAALVQSNPHHKVRVCLISLLLSETTPVSNLAISPARHAQVHDRTLLFWLHNGRLRHCHEAV